MNNEIINTPVRTKESIVADIKATEKAMNNIAVVAAISIGNDLKILKELIPHGEWLTYVEENLRYSKRKTQRFIQIAETYGEDGTAFNELISNASPVSHLSVTNALSLLSLDEEDVEAFVEEVPVEEISKKELEDEIRKYKAENDDLNNKMTDLNNKIQDMNNNIEEMKASGASAEDVEKERTKAEKLEEKLRKVKEKQEKEIQDAKMTAKEEARKEASEDVAASIRQLEEQREAAIERADAAEKRANNTANETLVKYKVAMDLIQQQMIIAKECVEVIAKEEPEKAEKMELAMKQVLEV